MNFTKSLAYSTALCAVGLLAANAAVAAEKPKLKISGYQETYFGVADTTTGTSSSGTPTYTSGITNGAATLLQYGEIRFLATGVTDTGMKWGVYFESTQDDASGTGKKAKGGSDEANVYMEGSWGKMEIGGQDGASDKLQVAATDLDLLGSNILAAYVRDTGDSLKGQADNTNVVDSSDDSKFTYYTPRISGIQAGVSYVPSLGTKGSVPNGSTSGAIESGVVYKGKAGSTTFQLGGVYSQIGESNTKKTIDGYALGAHVGFGAITLAAGYTHNNNWRADFERPACLGPGCQLQRRQVGSHAVPPREQAQLRRRWGRQVPQHRAAGRLQPGRRPDRGDRPVPLQDGRQDRQPRRQGQCGDRQDQREVLAAPRFTL